MKKSTILQIFRGERELSEIKPMIDEGYSKQAYAIYNKLEEILSEEQFDLLNDFIDKEGYAQCEVSDGYFMEGFKLGLRVGIECMED